MADDIDTEIAEIEGGMADDFQEYQGNPGKQARYGELLAAQESGGPPPAKPDASAARRVELEGLMADGQSAYWKGSQSRLL